jgi:hypothetical protein
VIVKEKKESKKHEKQEQKGKGKIHTVLEEFEHGSLRSRSKKGPKVTNKQQALAIAINSAKRTKKLKKK